MYLTSKKSAGKLYFYLARYTGKKEYKSCKYEYLFGFGNEKVALERMSLWLMDESFIPESLLEMGISIDDIKKFKNKVIESIRKIS